MKLDRNTNRGGHGKYALVNMRKLIPLLEEVEIMRRDNAPHNAFVQSEAVTDVGAFERLVERGIITLGNETPGDQFFVMKYKDIFTHEGLQAYADAVQRAVRLNSQVPGLSEYAAEMQREAEHARELGNRIPD